MKIIGCDFHPGFEQITLLDLESKQTMRKKLDHASADRIDGWWSSSFHREIRTGARALVRHAEWRLSTRAKWRF